MNIYFSQSVYSAWVTKMMFVEDISLRIDIIITSIITLMKYTTSTNTLSSSLLMCMNNHISLVITSFK